ALNPSVSATLRTIRVYSPRYSSLLLTDSEQWEASMPSADIMRPMKASLPSEVQRYFEIALYLMVCTGFATLASTGGLGAITVLMVSAALLYRGYLLIKGRAQLIAEWWTSVLTLGYV